MQHGSNKYPEITITIPPDFKKVFSHFYTAHNDTDEVIKKTFFPSYQTMMVFNFGDLSFTPPAQQEQIPVGKCLVLGPVRKAFDYRLGAHSQIFVVNFKGDGFYRFFSKAMAAGCLAVHPDKLVAEDCFSQLWHQLQPLHSDEERADYILQFSRPYLAPANTTVHKIVDQFRGEAEDPIKKVADITGQSRRNVQLKHKRHLGYSAKAYARYQRFIKTIGFLEQLVESSDPRVDWFEVVERNGYYDQSHLIRDFRYFLDLTPSQYIALHQDICIGEHTGNL